MEGAIPCSKHAVYLQVDKDAFYWKVLSAKNALPCNRSVSYTSARFLCLQVVLSTTNPLKHDANACSLGQDHTRVHVGVPRHSSVVYLGIVLSFAMTSCTVITL